MSDVHDDEAADAGRLAGRAAETIGRAGVCWLATAAPGAPRLRPMGRLPPETGDDAWTFRFVTDGRSAKVSDIRRTRTVGFVFEQAADEAFVAATGEATLIEDAGEVRRRWRRAYDPFFPTDEDKASAVFLIVRAERLDLWIRGVTPEPFGLKTTTLERDDAGGWRLL